MVFSEVFSYKSSRFACSLASGYSMHVIFSWTQIGRFWFSDREVGSQVERFFRGKTLEVHVQNLHLRHSEMLFFQLIVKGR